MDSEITTEATQDFSTMDSSATQRKLSLSAPWTAQSLQNPSEISAPRRVLSPLKQGQGFSTLDSTVIAEAPRDFSTMDSAVNTFDISALLTE